MAPRRIKADTLSHLMHIGSRDWESGKLDAAPITTMGWTYYREQVDFERLKSDVMEQLVKRIFRYRAVPRERKGWTYWEEVDELDEDYHFQHVEGFDTEEEWQAFLESTVENALDYSKPWWRYVLVDRLPCGRCAVLGIADHTHGDGASGIGALLSMCEGGDNPVFQSSSNKGSAAAPKPKKARRGAVARSLSGWEQALALWEGVVQPLKEQVMPNDAPSTLKQPTGVFPKKWHFATTPDGQHLDVQRLRAVKERVPGATVNDVMLAITALSIREYYRKIKDPIMDGDKDLRGTYAVNARPSGVDYLSDKWFGNHIVISTTRYPLHESRVQTLLSFRDQSRLKKASPDTAVRQWLNKALTFLPRDQVVEIAAEASCKFSIMISNVLFSLTPLTLFGQEIDDVRFIACAPLGYYAGAATYKNKVSFGLVATEDTGTDPREILPLITSEFEALYEEVMALPADYFIKQDRPKPVPVWVYALLVALIALLALRLVA